MELDKLTKNPDTGDVRGKARRRSSDHDDAMDKEEFHRDPMTDVIGPAGPFQIMWHLVLGLSVAVHAWQMFANKWLTYKVNFN
jgi:hypothetical protein